MADSGDVEMGGTSVDDDVQPIDYKIPQPPKLFYRSRNNKKEPFHETVWENDAQHYFAKRNASGTGFDVCQEEDTDPNDPTLWPYRLGPPTSTAPCHPLIERWGLQVLEAAGFVNYHQDDPGNFMYPQGRWAREQLSEDDLDELIHPALRRGLFPDVSDGGYDLITPAIILASAFLEIEDTLTFFHAMSSPSCWSTFTDSVHGVCGNIRIPDTLSADERVETYDKICGMSEHTSWRIRKPINNIPDGVFALTAVQCVSGELLAASIPGTLKTYIVLNAKYLAVQSAFDDHVSKESTQYKDYFERSMSAVGVPSNRKIDIDLRSANLRANLQLAITIIHEFAHAICKAYYPSHLPLYREPWIADNRSNEMGYSLVQHVLGGGDFKALYIAHPSMDGKAAFQQKLSVPFGFYFEEKWDLWRGPLATTNELVKSSASDDVFKTHAYYPVPQQYVEEMYGKEMWTRQVPRFGLKAIRASKLPLWSVRERSKRLPATPGTRIVYDGCATEPLPTIN